MMRIEKSYCRLCFGMCGMDVVIEEDRVVAVKPDLANPLTQGYSCLKGRDAPAGMYGPSRNMQPLKRVGDQYVPIGLEQALDEIGDKLRTIIAEHGEQSVALFRGTGTFGSSVAVFSWPSLAETIGAQRFSTMTIDQSAKWVADDRLGSWEAGWHSYRDADVWMFVGTNPMVSVWAWNTPAQNPTKHMKEARARGMKVIVIDPRASELTKFADIHLQLYPGEDPAVAAGMIHIILREDWHDAAFCAENVAGLDELHSAVASFTPEMVSARAGISAHDLVAAAKLFAEESRRGGIDSGTGSNMAAFPNLAEHLYRAIGVICGRFRRAGEVLPSPGVLFAKPPPRAQAKSPLRSFETSPKSRVRGAAMLMGEKATPTLAEEILTPGEGQIRALLISGANPANAIPDSAKVVDAMRSLDLLVVVEPFQSETARLADYVLPPKILYEHADITCGLELTNLEAPYAQYTDALVPPPAGSELADEGYIAWSIAKRLGLTFNYFGTPMDMTTPPADETFMRIFTANSNVPFEELKTGAVGGRIYADLPEIRVQPADATAGRFEVMPADVAAELAAFGKTPGAASLVGTSGEFPLRLIARRARETVNTSCRDFPSTRKRMPYNPLAAHPSDLVRLGLRDGDECWVVSVNGRIPGIVKADATLKPGVVSMTHGFGGLPSDNFEYRDRGSSVSMLVSLDRDCEPLQAMPLMSGVPVRVEVR
jgi:anaerobic selenocysteine-containing dehydrogenase